MNISTKPEVWFGALVTIAIFSFLFKENPVFRFVEHLYVGIGSGHAIAIAYTSLKTSALTPISKGQVVTAIPVVIGVLLYTQFFRSYAWISRLCLAIPIGLGIGIALRGLPSAQIWSQIAATMVPLDSLGNIVLVFGTMGTLAFFFFTTKRTAPVRVFSEIGKWTMMITFGLTVATSVAGQMAGWIGALQKIFGDWLGIVK